MRRFFGKGMAVLVVGGLVGACGSSGDANLNGHLKGDSGGISKDGGSSCASNSECAAGLCLGGVCASGNPGGGTCTTGPDCASGVCQAGICVGNGQGVPSGGLCTTNAQCSSGKCTTGKCAGGSRLPDGKSCATATECASGACTNGICGTDSSGGGAGGAAGGGGASGAAGKGGAGGTTGVTGTGGTVTSVTPIPVANACVATKSQATGDHLDIFIMQDRSGSMKDDTAGGGTKWQVITDALTAFVNDPKSAGIGAGIGFFSVDDGNGGESCVAADYAKPAVGIAPLTGNGPPIVAAIAALGPNGHTPTEPALQGAINYAAAWAKANPTHKVIVVFATDGAPNGCNSTPTGAETIAAAGLAGAEKIQTYVVGVIGQGTGDGNCPNGPVPACAFVQTLNGIAKSGGTGSAFIVNTTANSQAQFQAAMNTIRTANKVSCDYTIPAAPKGKVLQPRDATVQYTSGTKAPVGITWVANAAACKATGGWYYNSVTSPAQIHLCPTTCATTQADPLAHINVVLACVPPGVPGGSGGTTGAGGSGPGGAGGTSGAGGSSACLLPGQSCQSGADCCSGVCSGGVCTILR